MRQLLTPGRARRALKGARPVQRQQGRTLTISNASDSSIITSVSSSGTYCDRHSRRARSTLRGASLGSRGGACEAPAAARVLPVLLWSRVGSHTSKVTERGW